MTDGSDLKQHLADEMKSALKAGQKVRLSALRLLAASVKNREVELLHTLSDEELQEVALREVKRRNEAIEAYEAAGRQELVDREREERETLQPYIPAQLSDAEVDSLVDEALAATGAVSPQEMGKVMGFVMGRAKGKVDGSVVQAKVRSRLGA